MSPIPIPGGFADVDDTFEPLPAGTYDAVVFKAELKKAGPEAKNPGSDYIAWEFNITQENYDKRKAWLNTSLVSAALPMLKRFLKALGHTEEELNNPEFQLDTDEELGKPCRLIVTQGVNPNTQEPNHSVKRVLAPGEQTASALP